MLSRNDIQKVKKIRTYEQYIEDYKQWKKDRECQQSQKSTGEKK